MEKEAKERHLAAMAAEVERLNLELSGIAEDLEGILAATLDVDDFVDLESLKVKAVHPPFLHSQLEIETPRPLPVPDPPAPTLIEPLPPKGLFSVFGRKKYEKSVVEARATYESECEEWRIAIQQAEAMRVEAAVRYEEEEQQRLANLRIELDRYDAECAQREQVATEQNRAVDDLIANLGYGVPEAIEEYIGIVISNAIYPDHFPVNHEYSFRPDSAELSLRVSAPAPDQMSTVKAYKYTKATDEITEVPMSTKACKDRYAGTIHKVALRAAHEIFEADRRALIGTISLEVGTHAINPATGVSGFIPF
ncbi:MAG TPA: hypothetical protein VMS21_10505, partial [Methylomirabilota bacterium]|nr:hypothetical protein [Methylomirabilota bacterium]